MEEVKKIMKVRITIEGYAKTTEEGGLALIATLPTKLIHKEIIENNEV